jgi:hypothetical protein
MCGWLVQAIKERLMITRSMRDRVIGWSRLTAPAFVVLILGASQASASFLESGTTHMSSISTPVTSGILAFAVYDTTGGTATDPYNMGANNPFTGANPLPSWIASSPALGGTYLYLYGISNDSGVSTISQAAVNVSAPMTMTGTTNIEFLTGSGPGFIFNTAGPPMQNSPALLTGPVPSFMVGGQQPALFMGTNGTGLQAFYGFGSSGILQGQESAIFGFTSPFAPVVVTASLQGSQGANGNVLAGDVAVPEPSSLVMAGIAIPVGLVYVIRRRRARTV